MANREKPDREKNRFSARAARYARVGANVSGVAARYAGRRMLTGAGNRASEATAVASALGRLKGPLMKVAQLMATIPDLLPPEYATELQKLQSEAPPMGWAFVKRRMMAELGADWEKKFKSFEHQPAAAASLGQVHRARSLDGAALACKLQYPDMQSAVEADLSQLEWLLAIRRRFDSAIDTTEIGKEIGARVREELDYRREAKHVALYREMLAGIDIVRVPRAWPELSTGRLLTLDWLDGTKMLAHKNDPLAVRNALATAMFTAWWFPFSRFGVIHGDPHLGNYSGLRPTAANPPASIFSIMAASAFSRRNSSAAWSTSITGSFTARTISSSMPTRPGVSASCRATSSTRSISGRASSTRRSSTIACAPSPTAWRRANMAGAKHFACIRRSRRKAPSKCRANSSSWTAPRSGSARCFCISARS